MRGFSDLFRLVAELVKLAAAAGIAAATWRYAVAPRGGSPVIGSPPEPGSRGEPGAGGNVGDDDQHHADGHQEQSEGYEPHIEIDKTPESTAAATGAAVAHVLARPDSIRQRAQNAAAISSAVIAALAVASITQIAGSGTESWEPATVVLVLLALSLWIVTIAAFVRVVTHGTREKLEDSSYQGLIKEYEAYSNRLRGRLRTAAGYSAVALVVTAFAVGFEVFERNYERHRERQLVLTPSGMSAVASLCGWRGSPDDADNRVNVRVSSDELSNQIVELSVLSRPAQASDARPNRALDQELHEKCAAPTPELRLPRAAILAAGDLDP